MNWQKWLELGWSGLFWFEFTLDYSQFADLRLSFRSRLQLRLLHKCTGKSTIERCSELLRKSVDKLMCGT